uniref:Uncharacterized protein n=1 Tax=Triticum urartu TaxID=4572 RepID=A0A8R7Q240_TRIUA
MLRKWSNKSSGGGLRNGEVRGRQLRHVQEEERHHHRAHRHPHRRERAPGRRREAPVAVPQRGHRRAHAVQGVHRSHPFALPQHQRPRRHRRRQQRPGRVQLVPRLVHLHGAQLPR